MIAYPTICLVLALAQLAGQADLVPQHSAWPGVVVIVAIALFVTAAVAGPLIRANSDDPSDSTPTRISRDLPDE